ncbi:hypothetical protein PYW08_005822 [Mythimna loreyi]|uniref:Uncharacterized protein n=1 Tax=Mythimna loreyi TaxID=667449 RepID=A0ACC2QHN0_9NEOP|nr:hypothetical protein PYW08_005822 [Mythimna loreyi]
MFHKKFEHYVIFCLIKQITMILFVSGRPTDSGKTLFTKYQLSDLAYNVCGDLALELNVTEDACMDKYWAPDTSMPKNKTSVKILCQTNTKLIISIEPSEKHQLVALVPDLTEDINIISDINYLLLDPNENQGVVYTTPKRSYTLWSTELEQGSPVAWQGGDKVPDYDATTVPPHKRYTIKPRLLRSLKGPGVLARFTWNTSGECDIWFDVVNTCKSVTTKSTKITLNHKGDEPQVDFDHLAIDDDCRINVTGMYGSTVLKYRTLTCKAINCEPPEIVPEIPDNIFIEANKDSMDTWEVRASWARPHRLPDSYTVTLSTSDANRTVVLHGDATDAVFKDVTGEATSSYYVLMQARLNKTIAYTSRRAQFPDTWDPPGTGGAGGAGGAAIGAGFAGAAALALLCRCRRRRHHVPVPPYKPDDKPTKESDTEVLEIWSETEDRWEVRADKLVLHEVIGEGAFGVVRRATLAPHSIQVAVKMLKDFPSLDEIRSFRSEMELMKSVGVHPHLVSLVGCCSGRRPLIIAEYCSRGDLLSYLRCTWDVMLSKRNAKYYNNNIDISDYRNDLFKCKAQMESSKLVVNKLYELQEICDKELTALDLLSFCRQIAMGMEFLAANRVVHRDLAARNILVTADRTLKIADFGLSRDVYEENQYKQKGNGKMPVKWMAVESLTRRIYTTQSDVWSFGVVVWEIATVGGAPYAAVPGARLPRLLRSGYRLPKPNNCSPQLYDIMLSCWRTHPRDRPTFAELHQRLDELLNSACANQYLSLEIDADDAPPTPKHHRYLKMLMRGKRGWTLSETYERALKAPHTNHYTTPPDSISAHPV